MPSSTAVRAFSAQALCLAERSLPVSQLPTPWQTESFGGRQTSWPYCPPK